MPRSFTPKDACALMTELVHEATGAQIDDVDFSSFVSAGKTVLDTGIENTLNALAICVGRRQMMVRPRKNRLKLIQAESDDLYNLIKSRIYFYARDPKNAGDWNTDLFTNLAEGFDNGSNPNAGGTAQSTASMWEQNPPQVVELHYENMSTYQDSTTVYQNAMAVAMRSPEEFADFMNSCILEKKNDLARQKEAYRRMTLLNFIAGTYDMSSDMPGAVINLTAAYNTKYSTSYTSEQLRTTYFDSFIKFFTEQFKLASEWLTYDTTDYHLTPTKLDAAGNQLSLIQQTDYADQRCFLYEPLFVSARASVLPDIFNPSYLDLNTQFEGVMYWQAKNAGPAIDCYPAVFDKTNGVTKKGNHVQLPYVVGVIFDKWGLSCDHLLEAANTSPLEARKRFYNIWYSRANRAINCPCTNRILFIMQDPPASPSVGNTRSKSAK